MKQITKCKYFTIAHVMKHPKTDEYLVENNGSILGNIKWHGAWRQYCFFPRGNTVFSAGCMQELKQFIEQLMEERKYARRETTI
jgi:hypothetical protein